MAVGTELRDRRATRRERSAVDAHRRKARVSIAALADHLGESDVWVWARISDRSYQRLVMLSDLRRIRAAIDEIVAEAKA